MRREPSPRVAETESPHLFPLAKARHRIFGGLNERQEHIFTWIAVVVVLLYVTGWIGAIHGDFEVNNILSTDRGPVLVDLDNAQVASREWDLVKAQWK